MNTKQITNLVLKGYIAAALWITTDDDGNHLDHVFDISDIGGHTFARMWLDCKDFVIATWHLHEEYLKQARTTHGSGPWEHFGHDFWLTRNGHGVGFWDRGYGDLGDHLSAIAEAAGTFDLILTDDGLLEAA